MASYTVTDGQSQTLSFTNTGRAPKSDTINVSGTAAIDVSVPGGTNESVHVDLAPDAHLTAAFHFVSQQTVSVTSDGSASLTFTGTSDFAAANPAQFDVDVSGPAILNVGKGGLLVLERSVGSDITVNLGYSAGLTVDQPAAFKGAINANDAAIHLVGITGATDYDLVNGIMTIYGGPNDQALDTLRLTGDSGSFLVLANQGGVDLIEQGSPAILTGTALPQHVAPVVPPPVAQQTNPQPTTPNAPMAPVAIADGTTGQALPVAAQAYAGPVPGLEQQIMMLTAQNLNITATAPNLFIHTGSGNDAIAALSGRNVLDGGTGSNFLTGGTGADTFFVDARGPTADVWSTVNSLQSGDSATVWGITPAGAKWAGAPEGAAGATGLTLHAEAGGHNASLTLAGFNATDLSNGRLSATFGQDAASGSSFLYVHAA